MGKSALCVRSLTPEIGEVLGSDSGQVLVSADKVLVDVPPLVSTPSAAAKAEASVLSQKPPPLLLPFPEDVSEDDAAEPDTGPLGWHGMRFVC